MVLYCTVFVWQCVIIAIFCGKGLVTMVSERIACGS